VIFNSNLLSVKSNLDINDTYDLVNNNSSTIDSGENDASNSEAVLLSNKSQNKKL
jgi:hypothetical protein